MFSFSPAMVRLADPTRKACGAPVSSQGRPDLEVGLGAPLAGAPGAVPVAHGHVAALHEAERSAAVSVGSPGEVAALHVADEQSDGPSAGALGEPHDPSHARRPPRTPPAARSDVRPGTAPPDPPHRAQ